MTFIYITNNAYDTLAIIDSNKTVISAWDVTPDLLSDYIAANGNCDGWDLNFPAQQSVADYGTEVYGEELQERLEYMLE